MKALNKSLLGAAIAALLSTSAAAMDSVRPPLLPGKLQAQEMQPPSDRIIVKFRDSTPMMASSRPRPAPTRCPASRRWAASPPR